MSQDPNSATRQKPRISKRRKSDFKHNFYIESFGVRIGFSTNSADALEAVKESVKVYLPDCFTEIDEEKVEHNFLFVWNEGERDTLYKNGERIFSREKRETSVESVASQI